MRYVKLVADGNTYTHSDDIERELKDLGMSWLMDCEFDGADLEVDRGVLVWHEGVFYWGKWRWGVFAGGEFRAGDWLGGVFRDGEFKGGTWHNGVWKGGSWKGGVWKAGEGR